MDNLLPDICEQNRERARGQADDLKWRAHFVVVAPSHSASVLDAIFISYATDPSHRKAGMAMRPPFVSDLGRDAQVLNYVQITWGQRRGLLVLVAVACEGRGRRLAGLGALPELVAPNLILFLKGCGWTGPIGYPAAR
jgi:hypothetical protein